MKIKPLTDVAIQDVVECLTKAFDGYFVTMPSDVQFWESRFSNSRVDMSLSWGAFDEDKLVGFAVNAIDLQHSIMTAFNTGTGVLPAYRGNQLVDKMYDFGMESLVKGGVKRCSLEVIDRNDAAIKVYERIGFRQKSKLFCYKGTLERSNEVDVSEVEIDETNAQRYDQKYSWDNTYKTIKRAGDTYKCFLVTIQSQHVGYFIINPITGYIAQLEAVQDDWKSLFQGVSQINAAVKINNIREDRKSLLSHVEILGFENTINQIDMDWEL